MTSFQNLNLNPQILESLAQKGYDSPTPIQEKAIPHLIAGSDLLGIAQTGTGKTAAFSLPILHNLSKSKVSVKTGSVRALILTPTRELASQIADNIEIYSKNLKLNYSVIFGGVSEKPQITAMQRGVDILIATPGRLIDLMDQGYIRPMQLEVLVLDEADRMLDMGFINDIKKIIGKIPKTRQNLLFSATMPPSIDKLAQSILNNPVKVEVTPPSSTVDRIEQKVNFIAKGNKPQLLKRILRQKDLESALVFSRTKHGANRIEEFLQRHNISSATLHSNKSQSARERALSEFREGKVKVLIATDIAARGIDIPAISHVINFDIPNDPESYVHRIGRTARAGRKGIAISFCDPSELKFLEAVEKTIKFKITVDNDHPYHGVSAPAAEKSKNYKNQSQSSFSNSRKKQYSKSSNNKNHSQNNNRNKSRNNKSASKKSNLEKSQGILGAVGNWFKGLTEGKKTTKKQPTSRNKTNSKNKKRPYQNNNKTKTSTNRSRPRNRNYSKKQ